LLAGAARSHGRGGRPRRPRPPRHRGRPRGAERRRRRRPHRGGRPHRRGRGHRPLRAARRRRSALPAAQRGAGRTASSAPPRRCCWSTRSTAASTPSRACPTTAPRWPWSRAAPSPTPPPAWCANLAGRGVYSALRGQGAWRDGEPLRPLAVGLREGGRIPVVVMEAVLSPPVIARHLRLLERCGRVRLLGAGRAQPLPGGERRGVGLRRPGRTALVRTARRDCSSSTRRARWSPIAGGQPGGGRGRRLHLAAAGGGLVEREVHQTVLSLLD